MIAKRIGKWTAILNDQTIITENDMIYNDRNSWDNFQDLLATDSIITIINFSIEVNGKIFQAPSYDKETIVKNSYECRRKIESKFQNVDKQFVGLCWSTKNNIKKIMWIDSNGDGFEIEERTIKE